MTFIYIAILFFSFLFFIFINIYREDFNIIAESGNYDHWKYSVEYTEHLSYIPIIRNTAYGHYAIREDNNGYLITSKHQTCFFFKFGCCEWIFLLGKNNFLQNYKMQNDLNDFYFKF